MFKKTILISIVYLLICQISFAQEESDSNRIFWSDWYKLEWSDYQSIPNTEDGIAAQSSIGLPYRFVSDGEGQMTVTINVCFLKNESWSKKEKENNVLLQHEQLHFNIAELHRRIIVKQLSEAKFNKENHKELLDQIINKVWLVDYRKMQDDYDDETNFSRIIREQINWNKYVEQQLINYKDYTYTEIEISLINR